MRSEASEKEEGWWQRKKRKKRWISMRFEYEPVA